MLQGCAIFILTVALNGNVLAYSCDNENCKSAIDIPLVTKLNAPLKAELDISILTEQLKELIGNEVQHAVSVAMKDLAENIVDKRNQIALENLQTYNNLTISTFLQKMEDVTTRKNGVRIMEENLEKSIEQQKLTESKLSSVEAQLKNSTKEVLAMTAHPSSGGTQSSTIMKFDDVTYSVGITNLSTYKTTGTFTCEHEGLYLISASVMSHTNGANYYIRLNGRDISLTNIGQHSGSKVFTGAVTVTRKLNPNDQVWLYASGSWYLYEQLKELIGHEVKQAVLTAMNDIVEKIVDKTSKSAVENLKTYNNLSISTFQKDIEDDCVRKDDFQDLYKKQILTESRLSFVESKVKRTAERVAMTAHPSSQGTIGYAIIKFDNIKYSVGITNLSTYKTTGKFTCEHEGLYLISASVMSNTNKAYYHIRLNGNDISYTYIVEHSGSKAFTGAVTVTTMLNPNDQVWLYAGGSWFIYSGLWSKLTIIKIK
ncbi:unnamed protein product [Mytilus edulis]|uniref:C1q domain-containing protein n=1 Tax=Mytilus edulis TaxID=6550 RepID=A0A8S3UMQ6_MYTED|nr:unnamed protein product [Mytilus edulis]